MSIVRTTRRMVLAGVALAILAPTAAAPGSAEDDFARPKHHFRVENPASLSPADALVVYNRIVDKMVAAYAISEDPSARPYRKWRRYNRAPYRSATHGDRFVNNYANPIAKDYDRLSEVEALPVGSILAKDSFAVTALGDVFSGPLFLMEKMPKGFNAEGRDWRYTMILPDGSYFGSTGGDNAERVEFCMTCHQAAGDENDHLFFVPEDNRVSALRLEDLTR